MKLVVTVDPRGTLSLPFLKISEHMSNGLLLLVVLEDVSLFS